MTCELAPGFPLSTLGPWRCWPAFVVSPSNPNFSLAQHHYLRAEGGNVLGHVLLGHAVDRDYLHRGPRGDYRPVNEAFRRELVKRVDSAQQKRLIRRALPQLVDWIDRGHAPARLCSEVAEMERLNGHPEKAFRWFLIGALRVRSQYNRAEFLQLVDQARDCYRGCQSQRSSKREVDRAMEEILGPSCTGLSGLERMRKLPATARVKILDFGIARRSAGDQENLASEGAGSRDSEAPWGTPRYMSPEQARGDALTAASDVYSFGIVARELLERTHPFGEKKGNEAARAAREGGLGENLDPKLPPMLRELLAKVLADDSRDRPVIEEVAAELQRIQLALVR